MENIIFIITFLGMLIFSKLISKSTIVETINIPRNVIIKLRIINVR